MEIGRAGSLVADGRQSRNLEDIMHSLEHPSWDRLFHIYDALILGVPIESQRKDTKFDRWVGNRIMDVVNLENELRAVIL